MLKSSDTKNQLQKKKKKKPAKNTNTGKLNIQYKTTNGSLSKSKRKFKKYIERNKNENMMIQNLWDTAKAVLRGQLIMIQAYLRL